MEYSINIRDNIENKIDIIKIPYNNGNNSINGLFDKIIPNSNLKLLDSVHIEEQKQKQKQNQEIKKISYNNGNNSISNSDLELFDSEQIEEINQEIIDITVPVKKKKGRKSKKTKLLELEQAKTVIPVRLFPILNEKIFDVVKINGDEYFYDADFNILLDKKVVPIGLKLNSKYIFYSDTLINIKQVQNDNHEVKKILGNFGLKN